MSLRAIDRQKTDHPPVRSFQRPARVPWRTRFACTAILFVAGCTQILGLHERPQAVDRDAATGGATGDAGATPSNTVAGQCGSILHSSTSCASCVDQSCCAEARACGSDPACHEASDCLAACSDAPCRARCETFYTRPDTLLALRSCRVRQCASACGSTCGEFASPASSCQSCQEASCCTQGVTCASDTNCAALNRCISNCFGAASCPSDCQTQYSQGATDYGAWSTCTNQQCAASCQSPSWACLDTPIVWPKPNNVGNITFSVTFVNFSGEQPFAGTTVKACGKLDYACSTPLAQSTTDATGLVSLTVPAGLSGFDGYLDLTGGKVDGTGASVFPALWYPLPFVVADGWRGRTQTLATDEVYSLTTATGTTIDPARGHFAINAVDCAFAPAAGVSFSLDISDPRTVSYYLISGVPVTGAAATDSSGIGAFLNLPTVAPARLAVLKATSGAASGKSMGSLSFIIRPGTFTTGSSFPPIP